MGPLILWDGTTNSGVGPLRAPLTGWFVGRPCGNTAMSHLAIFLIIVVDCANVWLSGPIVGGFVVTIRGCRRGHLRGSLGSMGFPGFLSVPWVPPPHFPAFPGPPEGFP